MKIVKHKFHAVRTKKDGRSFDSKIESRYYQLLKIRQQAGEVLFFLLQVPFQLPGMKYVADFMVFLADGTVEVVDVKGKDTPMSKAKRKAVEELYPIEIKIVTKV